MSASDAELADLKDERVPACLYWSEEEVAHWIESLGFPQYKNCILLNCVTGQKLVHIHASSLPKLGINDFDHIKKITSGLREMLMISRPQWDRSITLPPREELGLYLEMKSMTGEKSKDLTYEDFLREYANAKWQPPLNNYCMLLPASIDQDSHYSFFFD